MLLPTVLRWHAKFNLCFYFQDSDDDITCKHIGSEFKSVNQLAKPVECVQDKDDSPTLIEQHIFEPDQSFKHDQPGPSNYQVKLEISHRPANSEYVGSVQYINKEHKDTDPNRSKCR